jgi:hypothetical protein
MLACPVRAGIACFIAFLGCGQTPDLAGGHAAGGGGGGAGAASGGDGASGGSPPLTGEAIWSLRGDGLGSAHAVAADDGGNVTVVGVFRDTLDFGAGPMTSAGANDVFVARFDAEGHCTWSVGFGGALDDAANSVAVDSAGDVLVTGAFQGTAQIGGETLTSAGSYDVYVAKLDSQGDPAWVRRFGVAGFDVAYGVAASPTGTLVLMGRASGPIDFGGGALPGEGTTFVVRLDGSGDQVSGRWLGPGSCDTMAVGSNDDVLLGGGFSGTMDLGTGPLVSQASTDGFVARFDPDWNAIFVNGIGEGAYTTAYSVATDPSDGIVVGGTVQSNGVAEAYVAVDRFSAVGELEWSRRFGAAEYAAANSVAVDGSGNLVLAGYFRNGTIDFGCGPLESPLDQGNALAGDMFLAKLDAGGSCLWSRSFGGKGQQFASGTAVDPEDRIFLVGEFQNAVSFGTEPLQAEHYPEPCVAKFHP